MKLLVIADDLSGATDVGVQFATRGIPAVVLQHPQINQLQSALRKYAVVLIDLETRHLSPSQAAERVRTLTLLAHQLGVDHFYKKTDSTLRGNIGAELDALLRASGRQRLCFVPAHPLLGRTTRAGTQYVHGKPLHESDFSRDPRNPMTESHIPAILRRQTALPINTVAQLNLSSFIAKPPAGISVFDAETLAELKQAAAVIKAADCLNLLAGPAALASCLPDLLPFEFSVCQRIQKIQPHPPFLLVNGSLSQIALDQCAFAADRGFTRLELSATTLFKKKTDALLSQTADLLRQGRNVLLGTVSRRGDLPEFEREALSLGISPSDLPETVAAHTGHFVASLFEQRRKSNAGPFTLIVIGGDTLAGIAHANQWPGFVPRMELQPGVALCQVPELDGITVVTKPGGFGPPDFISKLISL